MFIIKQFTHVKNGGKLYCHDQFISVILKLNVFLPLITINFINNKKFQQNEHKKTFTSAFSSRRYFDHLT